MEFLPFLFQGLVIAVDEFYCHQRRELRRWERWGHPLDTLFFSVCFAFLLFSDPNDLTLKVYGGLAAASCLFITKDEWEHRELSPAFENWLHAVLFVLHPVVLIWAGYLWWSARGGQILQLVFTATLMFAGYQLVYWNFIRKRND